MKNNLLKKLTPIVVAGAVSLATLVGCNPSNVTPTPTLTDQKLQLTVSYSGTARTYNALEKHDVHIHLSKDGQGYAVGSFGASVTNLNEGRLYTFPYSLEPGNYEAYIFWDWDNDSGGPGSTEPKTQPYPINITLDGLSTKKMSIQLVDQTNPYSPGSVEGIVDFNGNTESYLCVDVHSYTYIGTTRVYTLVSRKTVNDAGGGMIFGSSNGKIGYNINNIPAGGPYVTLSFLDTNHNQLYDSGEVLSTNYGISPSGDYSFVVSPGLPTVGINLKLNN